LFLHHTDSFHIYGLTNMLPKYNKNFSTSVTDFWIPAIYRGHENPRRSEHKFAVLCCFYVNNFGKYIFSVYYLRINIRWLIKVSLIWGRQRPEKVKDEIGDFWNSLLRLSQNSVLWHSNRMSGSKFSLIYYILTSVLIPQNVLDLLHTHLCTYSTECTWLVHTIPEFTSST
jgi:hypothetical protein